MDVGSNPGVGANLCPDTGRDRSPATDRSTLPRTPTAALSHLLGWNRQRRLQVLCYQYGGDSETGLQPADPSENWRCLAVENLDQVELLDAPWQTAENHSRPQTCIDDVELDVDDYPELPITKSAKL